MRQFVKFESMLLKSTISKLFYEHCWLCWFLNFLYLYRNLSTLGSPGSLLWSRLWLHLGLAHRHHLLARAVCSLPRAAGVNSAQGLPGPIELLLLTAGHNPLAALVAVSPPVVGWPPTTAAAPAVVTTAPPGASWPPAARTVIPFTRPSAPVSASYPEPSVARARAGVARSLTILLLLKNRSWGKR